MSVAFVSCNCDLIICLLTQQTFSALLVFNIDCFIDRVSMYLDGSGTRDSCSTPDD